MLNLPKVNGKIDTQFISEKIVTHILVESIVKHYGTRISNEEVKELERYVKQHLDEIQEEATNQ